MRFTVLLVFLLVIAPPARAADRPPELPPPSESMVLRELREIAARERVIWDRLRADPENAELKLRSEAEFRDVITAYENLLRSAPDYAEAYAAYGLILGRTGNRDAAVKAFLRANKLNPRLALVKNQLGNILAEDGDYTEALPYYLAAIELEPEEPLYHYQLGSLLHEFRRLMIADEMFTDETLTAKSHDAFRRAAALAPDNWGYAYRYAESFYDAIDPDWPAALAEWQKLEVRAKPGLELQTVRLHIARVLVEADRYDEARPILETITEPALQEHKQTVIAVIEAEPEK
jgi:tetratricopeptide (TPR) repeat protein